MKNIVSRASCQIDDPEIRLVCVWHIEAGLKYDTNNFRESRILADYDYIAVRTIKGEGVFETSNGNVFTLTPNTAVLFHYSDISRFYCKEAEWGLEFYGFFAQDISHMAFNQVYSVDITEPEMHMSENCFTYLSSESYYQVLYAQNLFKSLLALWHMGNERPSLHETNMDALIRYVTGRESFKMKISQIAAAADMSERTFRRVFTNALGISPKQYIEEKRLETALELLECTPKTIKEIAEYCGFYDQYHFNRCFKKRFGYPPKETRIKGEKP